MKMDICVFLLPPFSQPPLSFWRGLQVRRGQRAARNSNPTTSDRRCVYDIYHHYYYQYQYQYLSLSLYIYIYTYEYDAEGQTRERERTSKVLVESLRDAANLRTKVLDFGGFDSSIILVLRGGILMPIGNFRVNKS